MQAAHSIRQFVEHGAVLLAPGAQNILSNMTHLMGENLRQGVEGPDVVIADPDPVALVVCPAGDVEIRMFPRTSPCE